ncbi:hypothetical protein AAMO2058_000437900 [Amorphochlora amoebiformis]
MGFESASWASVPAVALALAAISHASGASAYQSVDTLERLGRRLAYIDRNFENLLGSEQNMTRPATGGCTLEMPLQVISLPSRGDRRRRIMGELERQKIPYHIMDAVDGRNLSTLQEYRFRKVMHAHHRLSAGMKGCILSHQETWAEIESKSFKRYHMILEDDADIPADFLSSAKKILNSAPYDAQIIYLGSCYIRSLSPPIQTPPLNLPIGRAFLQGGEGFRVEKNSRKKSGKDAEKLESFETRKSMENAEKLKSVGRRQHFLHTARRVLCSHAYMINEFGARILLNETLNPFDTIDQMMNHLQRSGRITSYVTQPDLVSQYASESDIVNPTTPSKSLDRAFVTTQEIRRALD